jgi:hypothetical protein
MIMHIQRESGFSMGSRYLSPGSTSSLHCRVAADWLGDECLDAYGISQSEFDNGSNGRTRFELG